MGIVFVLTDKGWKYQNSITKDDLVYSYNVAISGLDLTPIDNIVDVSQYKTYHLWNRNTKYGTYCNEQGSIALVKQTDNTSYNATIGAAIDHYYEYKINIPSSIKCVSSNVPNITPSQKDFVSYVRNIKLRDVGFVHFEMSKQHAAAFIQNWSTEYHRLNAVDYNQALMLQLVALKSGKLSSIEQEIGFNVRLLDKNDVSITDVVQSTDITIDRLFVYQDNVIHPIYQINGQVFIG